MAKLYFQIILLICFLFIVVYGLTIISCCNSANSKKNCTTDEGTPPGDSDDDDDNNDDNDDNDDIFEETWVDPESGLMWQVDPGEEEFVWETSFDHCESLALGGYDDWRVPSISELRSLVRGCPDSQPDGACGVTDYCTNVSCWNWDCSTCYWFEGPGANGCYWPIQIKGSCQFYWSSTEAVKNKTEDQTYSWMVAFHTGGIDYWETYIRNSVRCVR